MTQIQTPERNLQPPGDKMCQKRQVINHKLDNRLFINIIDYHSQQLEEWIKMNKITLNFIKKFCQSQGLDFPENHETSGRAKFAELFEYFIGYCVTYKSFKSDTLSLDSFATGGGQDFSMDSLAIILNGKIIDDIEEAKEILDPENDIIEEITLKYIISQSKLSGKFMKDEINNTLNGVQSFFEGDANVFEIANPTIKKKIEIHEYISNNLDKIERNPRIEIYYASPGEWTENKERNSAIATGIKNIKRDFILSSIVDFIPLDEEGIQNAYSDTNKRTYAKFNFANKITLPDASGILESYFGNLPLSEYLKIITNSVNSTLELDNLELDERVFEENIRGYQGDNRVNSAMLKTLEDPEKNDRFFALNNGVTIVARDLKPMGNTFAIQDFYVVNGCQTSNVLFRFAKQKIESDDFDKSAFLELIEEKIFIPVRLISTRDDSVIDSIVEATNSQTQVGDIDLVARSDFHKSLEQYMSSEDDDLRKLFYERRTGQFGSNSSIAKVRIVDKTKLLRYFGAMFLDEPTNAARFTGKLRDTMGQKAFNPDHKPSIYHVAAFAGYRLEYFFRKNRNDDQNKLFKRYKPLKWHILMVTKYLIKPNFFNNFNNRNADTYSEDLIKQLENDEGCLKLFEKALETIIDLANKEDNEFDINDKDLNKSQRFTDLLRTEQRGF